VESKLREEVETVIGNSEVITLAQIEKMPYLNNVIRESLRLYAPVSFTNRTALKDDVLCGYPVPAGVRQTFALYPIQFSDQLPSCRLS